MSLHVGHRPFFGQLKLDEASGPQLYGRFVRHIPSRRESHHRADDRLVTDADHKLAVLKAVMAATVEPGTEILKKGAQAGNNVAGAVTASGRNRPLASFSNIVALEPRVNQQVSALPSHQKTFLVTVHRFRYWCFGCQISVVSARLRGLLIQIRCSQRLWQRPGPDIGNTGSIQGNIGPPLQLFCIVPVGATVPYGDQTGHTPSCLSRFNCLKRLTGDARRLPDCGSDDLAAAAFPAAIRSSSSAK